MLLCNVEGKLVVCLSNWDITDLLEGKDLLCWRCEASEKDVMVVVADTQEEALAKINGGIQ